jgi:hypothetical protein
VNSWTSVFGASGRIIRRQSRISLLAKIAHYRGVVVSHKSASNLKPKLLLRDLSLKVPSIWEQVKAFRKAKGSSLPDWPDWCYLPLAAGYAISTGGGPPNMRLFDSMLSPAAITALATWRVSQGLYRFDADLFETLVSQPFEGKMPCEALKRLPEWCVYVETQGLTFAGAQVLGFFVHLESDANDGHAELRLLLTCSTGQNIPLPLHMGDWTLEESLRKLKEECGSANLPPFEGELVSEIAPYLQLVLYLCAQNADMPVKPSHPNTRVRLGGQVDVPKEARIWAVGERIGASIRKHRLEQPRQNINSKTGGAHAAPRPHVRRAHWHHFWTGPKDGEQKLVLRWLPPIPVGHKHDYTGPVVIHRVK